MTSKTSSLPRKTRNVAVLFDFENFKLGWQTYYRTFLSYFDICALLNKMEEINGYNIVQVDIFATAPKSLRDRAHRQIQDLKGRFYSFEPTSNVARHQLLTVNRVVNALKKELKLYSKMLDRLYTDQRDTESFKSSNFKDNQDQNSTEWFDKIGGVIKGQRRCHVSIQEFELRWHEERRIQRGCDAAIVVALAEAAEDSNIDGVVLVSGDSDFIQTLQQSKERSDFRLQSLANEDRMLEGTTSPSSSPSPLPFTDKAFAMLSFLSSFPIDVKKLFATHSMTPKVISPEGIEYCRIETAYPELNPQAPNMDGDKSKWLRRTAIPSGFYDGDYNQRVINQGSHQHMRLADDLVNNYQAATRRLEVLETKKGPVMPYAVGQLKVSDLTRTWVDAENILTTTPIVGNPETETNMRSMEGAQAGGVIRDPHFVVSTVALTASEGPYVMNTN